MTLFFEMLFAILPYISMFILGWLFAGKLDDMQHDIEVLRKYVNNHDKKFAALSKKAAAAKKK
jgi:hypothetical protein